MQARSRFGATWQLLEQKGKREEVRSAIKPWTFPREELVSNGNRAKEAALIGIRTRRKEELVRRSVGCGSLSELESPNVIDFDCLTAGIPESPQELASFGIEGVDLAFRRIVTDQDRIAHGTKVGWSQGNTPGGMKRSIHREVLHQIARGVEDVYESALSFIERRIGDPDLPINGLNAIGGKIFRNLWIIEGLHKVEGAVEHVDPAVRAVIGRI